MIKEQDLREAIAECQGSRNPDARLCIKLAAYYTILNNLYGETPTTQQYSFASAPPQNQEIPYSDSEFSRCVMKKGIEKVYPIIDELMDTLTVINPKLYHSVIQRISNT